MPTETCKRRIVLYHSIGRLSSLYQILGPIEDAVAEFPTNLPDVDFSDHRGTGVLLRKKPTYILYGEKREAPDAPVTLPTDIAPDLDTSDKLK